MYKHLSAIRSIIAMSFKLHEFLMHIILASALFLYFTDLALSPIEAELSVIEGSSTSFGVKIINDVILQRNVTLDIQVADSPGKVCHNRYIVKN